MEFKGNGQFSLGNLRETEISISPLESYRKCVCFPRIYQTKNVVKFHNFLQCREQRQRQILVGISILKSWVKIKGFDPFKVSLLIGSLDMRLMNVHEIIAGNIRTAVQKLNPDTFQNKANISFIKDLSIDRNLKKWFALSDDARKYSSTDTIEQFNWFLIAPQSISQHTILRVLSNRPSIPSTHGQKG